MRFKTVLIAGFSLVAIVAAGVAWNDSQRAVAAKAARSELVFQSSRAEAAARDAAARGQALQARRAEKQAALTALGKSSAAAGAASMRPDPVVASAPAQARAVTSGEVIANDPRVQALSLAESRAWMTNVYALFFRTARLSSDQAGRFLDNMMRRDAQIMDIRHVGEAQGLASDDHALSKLQTEASSEYTAAQKELLGPAGYAELNEYERGSTQRTMAGDIAGAAMIAGVPFTTPQIDQLVQALVKSANVRPGQWFIPNRIDWARFDEEVRTFATPAQLAFLTSTDTGGTIGGRFSSQFRLAAEAAKKSDASP